MAKPKTEKRNPRLIRRGEVVISDTGHDEVVRNVSVILHLANGADMVRPVTDDVEVVTDPQLPPEIEQALQNRKEVEDG